MSQWIEERAKELRFASGGDPAVLADLLQPRVVVVWDERAAFCVHLGDGRAIICAPRTRPDLLLHEVGHAEGTTGLGMELARAGAPWARLQIWREEAIANRFRATYLEDE